MKEGNGQFPQRDMRVMIQWNLDKTDNVKTMLKTLKFCHLMVTGLNILVVKTKFSVALAPSFRPWKHWNQLTSA